MSKLNLLSNLLILLYVVMCIGCISSIIIYINNDNDYWVWGIVGMFAALPLVGLSIYFRQESYRQS